MESVIRGFESLLILEHDSKAPQGHGGKGDFSQGRWMSWIECTCTQSMWRGNNDQDNKERCWCSGLLDWLRGGRGGHGTLQSCARPRLCHRDRDWSPPPPWCISQEISPDDFRFCCWLLITWNVSVRIPWVVRKHGWIVPCGPCYKPHQECTGTCCQM